MKFGVTMFPNNLEDVASQARLAEEMGFDYVGIADSQSLARELYVTLSVVAMSTERVMLGPTVSNPRTRHPAVASSAIASVNELSGGRAFLGIGSGDSAVLNLGAASGAAGGAASLHSERPGDAGRRYQRVPG